MIDFEIPAEAKAMRERVRQWVHDECIPAEKRARWPARDYKTVLGELRTKARAQGLWCPFIPKEYGGMGLGPARQRAGADGAGREPPGRAFHEQPGPRRRHHAHPARPRHRLPEGEVPQAAAERRKARLLLDDREGRRRRRHRHADPRRQGRQRELRPERREVVLIGRQRRRHGPGHGHDRSRRAAPPALLDLHRRAAQPRLPHQARHPDHGAGRARCRTSWAAATPRSRSRT